MAIIDSLSLRGIRNFDENEDLSIRLFCPLTLILGPNGTGKTSLIEGLKFATTGQFPPGSNGGRSFIRNAALATTNSVRGVVTAKIIDAMGNTYTVSRTIASLKAGTKFKIVHNIVTRVGKDEKEKTSVINRCADVDTELCVALGVSKSILNYVIFCHQDEFNWPFDQGKVLKERFDEIFDSGKYNKALENISKLYKNLQSDIRSLNAEKQTFKVLVSEVEDRETKLEEQKKRLDTTKGKINDINEQLELLKQKIEEALQFDSEYKNVQAEEEKKKMEYNMHMERYEKLRETVKSVFEGTTEELSARIESYATELIKEKNDETRENEVAIKNINEEETRILNILATRREIVGKLKQQVKDQERRVVRRNQLLNDALKAWDFDTVGSDVTEMEVKTCTKVLEQKMREFKREVEKNRAIMLKQERELQKEIDVLRTNYSKIESEKVLKEKAVTEITDEIAAIRNQITQIGAAGNKLMSIEQKLQAAKQKVEKLGNALDVDSVKAYLENSIKSRDEIEASLSAIDDEISSSHKLSLLTAEFDLRKSALQAKEEELQNLKAKHGDSLKKILGVQEISEVPQDNLTYTLDYIRRQLVDKIIMLTREIQAQECKTSALEATLQHVKCEIYEITNKLHRYNNKISAMLIGDSKVFEESLLTQSTIVKGLQDERGIYAHKIAAYKEHLQKLSANVPCCPLCHRNIRGKRRVIDIKNEIKGDKICIESDMKKCENNLKTQREKYDCMLSWKPVVAKIPFQERDLTKLKQKVEEIRCNIAQSRTVIRGLETSKRKTEKMLLLYENPMMDVKLWDQCAPQIKQLTEIVNSLTIQMNNAGVQTYRSRTIEEAQAQRDSIKTSLRQSRNDIDVLQLELSRHNERMHDARAAYLDLREEQLKMQEDMQKIKHLKDKQEDLVTRQVSMRETVAMLRKDLASAQDQLDFGTQRLEKTKADNWQKQETDGQTMAESTKCLSELHKMMNETQSFLNSNVTENLARYEVEIKASERLLTDLTNKRKDVEQTINKLMEDIMCREIGRRELQDNMTLRQIKETVEALEGQRRKLLEKLINMNHDEMAKKWHQLENEKQVLLRQKNIALGNQEELERAIKQYTQELRKEEYELSRENYINKCIELEVQENAVADLENYSAVLDAAMIDCFKERMSSVNKILKKLWQQVYKGTDTTCIEIDMELIKGADRIGRSYNYKLIQTKHGCKMDMKGHCSAGQKVLASILIRLALAETFCKDCGIFTLDEPTTNLDEENVNGLADTLTKVVELRSRHQKNFQLIIISHDEKFLQKLANLSNHKKFYELYRKNDGMTAVKLSDFNEPTNSLVCHMRRITLDESDAEEQRPNQLRKSTNSSINVSNKKRYNWNDFNKMDKQPTAKKCRLE
nr:PREDICTED: DNA repair protein RAD50-like [Linepithema humile]